jgi:acetyl esterase/lipase
MAAMGRFRRGRPLVAMVVVVGILILWLARAINVRLDRVDVPGGTDPTYVWGEPAGFFDGRPPRAVLMMIHGGGWRGVDRAQLARAAQLGVRLQKLGYATMAVDYRAGALGLDDVARFYSEARRRVDAGTPICAFGESAGGNLALLLAQREPRLDCVIANVAPTDLPALVRSSPTGIARIATQAFGREGLKRFSPALHPESTDADVFLLYSENDPLVPPEQGELMERALTRSTLVVLGPGDAPFGHILAPQAERGDGVDYDQLQEALRREIDFLGRVSERESG